METTLKFKDEERDLAMDALNGSERKWEMRAIYKQVRDWRKHGYKHVTKDKMLDILFDLLPNDLYD